SIPPTPPLAHFAPLPGSDRPIGMSSPTGYEHGQTGSRDMPTPTDDNDARQDWNAFQQAERQVLRNMHRTP
ncbi:hypothetical protein F1542_01755, partial [Komagataeibacter sp. FXV3]|nr:hypothetical protein [Komagataeibacter sp. FXV3]